MSEEEKPPLPSGKPRTAPPLTQLDRPKRPPSPVQGEDGGPDMNADFFEMPINETKH